MVGDETLINAAKKILSKEVKVNGKLKNPNGEPKMFGMPTAVMVLLLGGGGGSFVGLKALDSVPSDTAKQALMLAENNHDELNAREAAVNSIDVIHQKVDMLESNQDKIFDELVTMRKEQREDFKDLGNLIREESRNK